jgi:hypothetical protein
MALQTLKEIAGELPWVKQGRDFLASIEDELKKQNADVPLGNQMLHGLTRLKDDPNFRIPIKKDDAEKARDAFINRPEFIQDPRFIA